MSRLNFFGEKQRLKLLSLLFAVMLWLFVTMQGTDEMEIPLALRFINIPAGAAVREEPMPRLSVRVSGARILLLRQKLRGAVAYIDLSGTAAGRVDFAAMERYVRLGDGLRPLLVSPGVLTVELQDINSAVAK